MSEGPAPDASTDVPRLAGIEPASEEAGGSARSSYQRVADRVFQVALAVVSAVSAIWLFFLVSGRDGGAIFTGRIDGEAVVRVLVGFLIMTVLWGWLWYGIKRLALRKLVGLSKLETDRVFQSRMGQPFELAGLLRGHSERRVRIADMIGRRGRFFMIGMAGYAYVYSRIALHPTPGFLVMGLQESLFDALVFNWVMLATYYSNGFLGRVSYGAQTRIMDGALGRANCLVIFTLWTLFKFIMVPLGGQIAVRFPPSSYAAVFAIIWVSYLGADGLSEIVGSLFGRQKLRVWGLGEVNRKSVAGTWACFLGSLGICLAIVHVNGLGLPWLGLAVAVSVSNTVLELLSPRGTDDFTMATGNALLCWAFGCLVY